MACTQIPSFSEKPGGSILCDCPSRRIRSKSRQSRNRSLEIEHWAAEGNRRLHAIRREQLRVPSDFDGALPGIRAYLDRSPLFM